MNIDWIGHDGIRITSDNLAIYIDPYQLEDGGVIRQETRLFDANRGITRPMRGKEEANDYRYFPDPDLLPVEISADFVEQVRQTLPELPDDKRHRFIDEYGIKADDAVQLTMNRTLADFFEAVVAASDAKAQVAANWVIGDLSGALAALDGFHARTLPERPEWLATELERQSAAALHGQPIPAAALDCFELARDRIRKEMGEPVQFAIMPVRLALRRDIGSHFRIAGSIFPDIP